MPAKRKTIDGNEAAASIAYKLSEVIAIYPITPSSSMGELADELSSRGLPNLWGTVPHVIEMQSEGGAAGAVHGAVQAGALTTTFTCSQGLLLMIPNMYKIAGELSPVVFHVAARAVAAQALSIFGDHSDVMATRQTGFAMLASGSVQEAHDLALIAHAAALESRLPFLHFFDGFRTSREINKIEEIDDSVLRAMIDDEWVNAHRRRGLSPDHPVLRGTAQNPDVFFQAREAVNPYYLAAPDIVSAAMMRFATLTGRQYMPFSYSGAPDARRVLVVMGSGGETASETAAWLASRGEKVGVIRVHLYRPFSARHFLQALPDTLQSLAVLDRCKEPGSAGEPLYQDVVTVMSESWKGSLPRLRGVRYGLASKEFTPAMVRGIFEKMKSDADDGQAAAGLHHTVGIEDDITHTSLEYDAHFAMELPETVECVFWGLGSDGTVGANKNSIKIIGEETALYAQGYYYNDSKKSGSLTVSHLRFGALPIRAPYLIRQAGFVACHQFSFLRRYDVLRQAAPGATFLLNSSYPAAEVWQYLPRSVQETIIQKKLRFFVIDASGVARRAGLGQRINTIMQTCFFALSGVLPREEAIQYIKESIRKTYSRKGEKVVAMNDAAVDMALDNLFEVSLPLEAGGNVALEASVSAHAPLFVRQVLGKMMVDEGNAIPVSALPADGTYPTGTSRWEKRNIAVEIPVWLPENCIQCGSCVMVCPHAAIRQSVYDAAELQRAPQTFKSYAARAKPFEGKCFSLQVAPEDCTGCGLCVDACPVKPDPAGVKALFLSPQPPLRENEAKNWDFFLQLPQVDCKSLDMSQVRYATLNYPLFEFSGACSGCGETPYVRLLSQLFGERMLVANATGCSSIYGGNLPATPWSQNENGRGPAWSNSLFEDNAEFGLGMRLTLDKHIEYARELLGRLSQQVGGHLAAEILEASQQDEAQIEQQRVRVAALKRRLSEIEGDDAVNLINLADVLVRRSVWIVGGDGWAYDIGYGGLDHVLASGRNVNVLVLDTEVYSNTGGQASKSTTRGTAARFAVRGKRLPKKNLGLMAMSYGYVYVAQVAMGASQRQTLLALREADAYEGPSLVIAYAHCIEHGIDMRMGLQQQNLAVRSGYWPLYRYHPQHLAQGKHPLQLDPSGSAVALEEYLVNERRFRVLMEEGEDDDGALLQQARQDVNSRKALLRRLAAMSIEEPEPPLT